MNRNNILAKEMKIAEEFFGTNNDPEQMSINDESVKKLDAICDGWLSSELDENGEPISWAVVMPTQKQLAQDFLENKINEKQLLDLTVPFHKYNAVYFVSAITIPEHRGKGLAINAIQKSLKNLPLDKDFVYFAWPTTKEGFELIKKLEFVLNKEIKIKI